MLSNRKMTALLGAMALLIVEGLQAQVPGPPPAPADAVDSGKPDLPALKAAALAAEEKMPTAEVKLQEYFDLTPAQRERWQQFLPKTLLKLTRRQRVQIVILGDSILDSTPAEDGTDPLLRCFPGLFAKAMANQFFYTGGVRVLRPGSELRSKDSTVLGPEILLQPIRTSSIVSAASALATVGFQGRPDLVLVAHGLEDGLSGTGTKEISAAMSRLVEAARKNGLEVIVAGPIPQAADPEEVSLAFSRAVTSVMREFCKGETILFSDLGDLSRLVSAPVGALEPHLLFPAFIQQLQSRFDPVAAGGIAMPALQTHEMLGRMLFQDVMTGAPQVAWRLKEPKATLAGNGALNLEFQVTNAQKEPLALTTLPLVPRGWRPQDTTPAIMLAPGGMELVKVGYTITDTRHLPVADGKVRLPVLIIGGKESRIHDLIVPLQPFSVAWNERTGFNVESEFSPGIEIQNNTADKLAATWAMNWGGQKSQGKVDLAAAGSESLEVRLALPTGDKAPFRQTLPLSLTLSAAGIRQVFDRPVEITRNFGLKEAVPLTAADRQASAVTLRADADTMKLFLTLELTGVDLADSSGGDAYEVLLNLDARSYGQRLTPGATAAVRISGPAADGPAKVDEIAPWAFGAGYAAVFDPKEIDATLASSANGGRRLTISLPKGYLYLHEWALGNGNSQMGINVRLKGGGREYFLTRSSRQDDDAESLGVLELTDQPTRRWTVRVE